MRAASCDVPGSVSATTSSGAACKVPGKHSYETGDHLMVWLFFGLVLASDRVTVFQVYPYNDVYLVERLLDRLGLVGKPAFLVKSPPSKILSLPGPLTLEDALQRYLNITGALTRRQLQASLLFCACCPTCLFLVVQILARCAASAEEQSLLNAVAEKPESVKQLSRATATVEDILSVFPSIKMDAPTLLDLFPKLEPRCYSISCSPLVCELFPLSLFRSHPKKCVWRLFF